MRKFLKHILLFFLSFYGVFAVLTMVSNFLINENADFRLDKNISSIIIGNSQSECAYNDSLISNFKNLSRSAENYFYGYQKLKKVLEQNPQIEHVYIEFNPTNILVREDEKIWEDSHIDHHLSLYQPFLNFNDNALLGLKNSVGFQYVLLKNLVPKLKRISTQNYNYRHSIGGYLYLKRSKINEFLKDKKVEDTIQFRISDIEISKVDLDYLDKIIRLCNEKNIKPFLIRSPYHSCFVATRYESVFQNIRKQRFGNINFLDFKDFALSNHEFGDLQHLNYKGAKKFSLWFNRWRQDQIKR